MDFESTIAVMMANVNLAALNLLLGEPGVRERSDMAMAALSRLKPSKVPTVDRFFGPIKNPYEGTRMQGGAAAGSAVSGAMVGEFIILTIDTAFIRMQEKNQLKKLLLAVEHLIEVIHFKVLASWDPAVPGRPDRCRKVARYRSPDHFDANYWHAPARGQAAQPGAYANGCSRWPLRAWVI